MGLEQFIEKAKLIHGDDYDYSKVDYINNKSKVNIICNKCGNEFSQRPDNHLNSGHGCPICSLDKKNKTLSMTNEEFIEKSKIKFDNKYDYSKVIYINYNTPLTLICPIHGEIEITPKNHLYSKTGCNQCVKNRHRKTHEEFINFAKINYPLITILSDYDGDKNYIKVKCNIDGNEWETKPNWLKHGQGCQLCYDNRRGDKTRSKIDEVINNFTNIHGDKYDYSKVQYVNNYTKVCIICKDHGEFYQKPLKHLQNQGCPICNESKLEKETALFLDENNIIYERQKRFSWLGRQSLDFYLPDYNIGIECQGEQHFEPIDFAGKGEKWAIKQFEYNLRRDKEKYNLCKENGLKLNYIISDTCKSNFLNTYQTNNIFLLEKS